MRLAEARTGGDSRLIGVRGVPAEQPAAYRLRDAVRRRLTDAGLVSVDAAARTAIVLAWVRARGWVSLTETAELTGWSVPSTWTMRTGLAEEGVLRPGRAQRMGQDSSTCRRIDRSFASHRIRSPRRPIHPNADSLRDYRIGEARIAEHRVLLLPRWARPCLVPSKGWRRQ